MQAKEEIETKGKSRMNNTFGKLIKLQMARKHPHSMGIFGHDNTDCITDLHNQNLAK